APVPLPVGPRAFGKQALNKKNARRRIHLRNRLPCSSARARRRKCVVNVGLHRRRAAEVPKNVLMPWSSLPHVRVKDTRALLRRAMVAHAIANASPLVIARSEAAWQ
ncbi:MAG: hypothetical protein LBP52_02680, partial [Burkholderiaceae bacterium]|nr:hypothetical protein [Burkholderiaceae bacterium]